MTAPSSLFEFVPEIRAIKGGLCRLGGLVPHFRFPYPMDHARKIKPIR